MPRPTDVLNVIRTIVQPGEEFPLCDVYPTITWRRFSKIVRLTLGGLFFRYVSELPTGHPDRIVEPVCKNSLNQQVYRRV
jgi:hypothetical protein